MRRWHFTRRALATFFLTFSIAVVPSTAPAQVEPSPPDVPLRLMRARDSDRVRIIAAAREAAARYTEWLGPGPIDHFVVADRASAVQGIPGLVIVEPPWWPSPMSMDLEAQVSYGIAQHWFPHVGAGGMTAGVAWYLQSRVVERLFDLLFLGDGYNVESARYFGGTVPWTFRLLRLSRWTAGVGRAQFLGAEHPRRWPPGSRLPAGVDPPVVRTALAFATLERHLGWPALQGALRVVAERREAGTLSPAAFQGALGAAVGQDLSWFFERALEPSATYDYALAAIESSASAGACGATPCVRTQVAVERLGTEAFPGRPAASIGSYESGDAMKLRVVFADGQVATARWDGRAPSRRFEFEAPSAGVTAEIDPERVLALDANRLNNRKSVAPQSNVPVSKWVAQWLIWLQDAALTYGFAY